MRPPVALLCAVLAAALPACRDADPVADPLAPPASTPAAANVPSPRRGGLDATFIVTADTHVGYLAAHEQARDPIAEPRGIEKLLRLSIDQMNAMEGKPWPERSWGPVARPRGVFVAGDLTESGAPDQWAEFDKLFGLDGTDGLLRYPVYETAGNHDYNRGWHVRREIEKRHGARYYSVDWGDLHISCLGIHAGDEQREWLRSDLATVSKDRPLVVIMHYPLLGPFSVVQGAEERRAGLARVLDGYNVVGIFHGHFHASGQYRWEGYDVYNVGSVKSDWKSFEVVRVTDDRMRVASWNTMSGTWWWFHEKPINGSEGTPRRVVLTTPKGAEKPWMR